VAFRADLDRATFDDMKGFALPCAAVLTRVLAETPTPRPMPSIIFAFVA
jgi:hypothetical protein